MPLFRKLFLAQLVKHVELLTEQVDEFVTHRSQLNLDDDLSIGHHHCHSSEEHLQVLGQLLSTSVARVHGDEVADRVNDLNGAGFFGEHELWNAASWPNRSIPPA